MRLSTDESKSPGQLRSDNNSQDIRFGDQN